MIVKFAKTFRKYVAVLICLFIAGNGALPLVLCFGTDGHIELESAFHKRCHNPVHFQSSGRNQLSPEAEHEIGKHCGPCVDVPISIGLAKISRASTQQLNPTFLVPATNVIVATDKLNFSICNFASNTFVATSYFTPLRTIILLV